MSPERRIDPDYTGDSGEYPMPKKWKDGVWLPVSLLGVVVSIAVAWGTNANRLATVEQHSDRMEAHLTATDRQIADSQSEIAVLKAQLADIRRLLEQIDARLERAEEERRK